MTKIYNNSESVNESPKNETDVILTPYKYNGGQVYAANVDWAELTINGDIPVGKDNISYANGEIHLITDPKRPNGTKHYKCCYQVYLHGQLFAHIKTSPRASILDSFMSSIRIENNILYERGWVARYEYLCKEMNLKHRGVTRVDIAIDGGQYIEQYAKLLSKEYKKVGRAKMSTEHKHNGDVEGFYVGKRSSEKYIRGYNKTKEMQQSGSNKTYIVDFWKNNNIDTSGEVERLELVLTNKAIKRIKDFDLGRLEDSSYLASVMKSQLNKFYQFVENSGDSNVTRKDKIDAIDWAFFENLENVVRVLKTDNPSVIWAVKRAITFDMKEQFSGEDELENSLFHESYVRCYGRAEKYGIKEWFARKIDGWKKDFEYQLKIKEIINTVNPSLHFSSVKMMEI